MGPIVYVSWTIVGLVTIASIGSGLYFGYTGRWTLIVWRRIKLFSTLLGVLAIVFLMLNAENTLRSYWPQGLQPTNVLLFMDIRLEVADKAPNVCSQYGRTSRVCIDVLALQQSMDWWHSNLQIGYVEEYDKEKYAPELRSLIESVNNKIRILELQMMRPERYWAPSTDTRFMLFFFAAILLAFALGGSVGEAAYQLQQAEKDARTKSTASAS
jgi:hypothetical protein